jgi:hypothetical protein
MLHIDPYQLSMARKITGFSLIAAGVTGMIVFIALHHGYNNNTGG